MDSKDILFIAEVSANHLGDLNRARQIVIEAAKAGATAVKFQTYTAETMTLDSDLFAISQAHALWGGRKLYDLYDEAHTPWDWHEELFELARSHNLIPFSSPFDLTAVEFLEKLKCPIYKIASMETGDLQLIQAVGETGKPVIMSTGATEFNEITEAVEAFKKTGNRDLTLLVCTSSYPAQPKDAHLRRIELLKKEFGVKVGISDHTLGIGVSIAAIALGAVAIEKHFTLKREDGGADAAFSMEPQEFSMLVREGKSAAASLGKSEWSMQPSEAESRRLRRSLYIVKDVKKGDSVTLENIKSIRPGEGLPPKHLGEILGRRFNKDYTIGTPLSFDCFN